MNGHVPLPVSRPPVLLTAGPVMAGLKLGLTALMCVLYGTSGNLRYIMSKMLSNVIYSLYNMSSNHVYSTADNQ